MHGIDRGNVERDNGARILDAVDATLNDLRAAIRGENGATDSVAFSCERDGQTFEVWARCTGGDDHRPCITVMMMGED